jgi:hypothetical protein
MWYMYPACFMQTTICCVVPGSVSVANRTEAPKTGCAVVIQGKDGKSSAKVHSPMVSADQRQDIAADTRTPKSEKKPVNKRIVELQSNALMGPPASPAERQESSSGEHQVTPSLKNKYGLSQESPLHIPKLVESTPKSDTGWSGDPNLPTPKGPFSVSTPQTPYGQVLKPNPSPETRKNWKKWIDSFPDFQKEVKSPERKRKLSTVSYWCTGHVQKCHSGSMWELRQFFILKIRMRALYDGPIYFTIIKI